MDVQTMKRIEASPRSVLHSPRTTFGRPVHLHQTERELADLFAQGLVYRIGDGRRATFALTIAGRQLLRGADVD